VGERGEGDLAAGGVRTTVHGLLLAQASQAGFGSKLCPMRGRKFLIAKRNPAQSRLAKVSSEDQVRALQARSVESESMPAMGS